MNPYDIPSQYLDASNEIVTTETDIGNRQGDACQRAGFYQLGIHLLYINGLLSEFDYRAKVQEYLARLDALSGFYPGVYRRGAAPGWSHSLLVMSRDQVMSNIVALGLVEKQARGSRLLKVFLSNLSRLMLFTTNIYPNKPAKWYQVKLPDFTFFETWAAYIRAFEKPMLKPLLYLFDLSLLVNAMITVRKAKNPEFSDELTFQASLIQSQLSMPTFLSKMAVRVYNKRPMPAPPHMGYKSNYAPLAALNQYFGYNALSAPIDDVFAPTLQKVLKS